jgi:hypothetical protein
LESDGCRRVRRLTLSSRDVQSKRATRKGHIQTCTNTKILTYSTGRRYSARCFTNGDLEHVDRAVRRNALLASNDGVHFSTSNRSVCNTVVRIIDLRSKDVQYALDHGTHVGKYSDRTYPASHIEVAECNHLVAQAH